MLSSNYFKDLKSSEDKLDERDKISDYLQKLAFEALKVNHYMLKEADILEAGEGIYYQESKKRKRTFADFKKFHLGKILLSQFLHSPDSEQDKQQDYYFLHLTFQEYFAARYLSELLMNEDEVKVKDTIIFIKNHKYEQRFQYMLWFTVGLLNLAANNENKEYAENGQSALNHFFETFFQAPRDLIGDYEALFLMRCLVEGQLLTKLNPLNTNRVWLAVEDIVLRIVYTPFKSKGLRVDQKNLSQGRWSTSDWLTSTLLTTHFQTLLQSLKIESLLSNILIAHSNSVQTWENVMNFIYDILPYCRISFFLDKILPTIKKYLLSDNFIIRLKSSLLLVKFIDVVIPHCYQEVKVILEQWCKDNVWYVRFHALDVLQKINRKANDKQIFSKKIPLNTDKAGENIFHNNSLLKEFKNKFKNVSKHFSRNFFDLQLTRSFLQETIKHFEEYDLKVIQQAEHPSIENKTHELYL